MKTVEVKNFKLYTTAVISIEWKQELLNVNLDLAMMLKMMEIEGLSREDIQKYSDQGKPIPFKKVVLNLFTDDDKPGQYYTDESFCEDDSWRSLSIIGVLVLVSLFSVFSIVVTYFPYIGAECQGVAPLFGLGAAPFANFPPHHGHQTGACPASPCH